MSIDHTLIAEAQRLADDVLFPAACDVDRSGDVPVEQLDALAAAGMYGASVQAEPASIPTLIEILASGCLTTAFIWTQHLGAAAAAATTDGAASRFADGLASGRLRGGVAFAHMLRPDPPLTTATPVGDEGYAFSGHAPWVTGWGHIDLVHAAARHGDDIVWALLDARDGATLRADRYSLAAVDASATVELTFDDHHVPADRVTRVIDRERWLADYRLGLRTNGSFPLGVARRCVQLLDRPKFERRLAELRDALDAATAETVVSARADASLFAVRAATALVAQRGGRSVTSDDDAQRLHREAMFLLVQGQTPAIKQALLERLEPAS